MKPLSIMLFLIISMGLSAQNLRWEAPVKILPENGMAGQKITFSAELIPVSATEVHNIIIRAGIDEEELITQPMQVIRPNQTQKIFFMWTATEGEHTVFFKAISNKTALANLKIRRSTNPDLQKAEGQPIVKIEKTFSINPPIVSGVRPKIMISKPAADYSQPVCEGRPLPDLVVADISISGSGRPGDMHYISADIENRGQCGSGPFKVKLQVIEHLPNRPESEKIEIGTENLTSLPPRDDRNMSEASTTAHFQYTVKTLVPADYEFIIVVDPTNAVEEFREENNEAREQITIQ